MSLIVGYKYTCDRADCDEHIEMVPRDKTVAEILADKGWTVTGRCKHLCPEHSAPVLPDNVVSLFGLRAV